MDPLKLMSVNSINDINHIKLISLSTKVQNNFIVKIWPEILNFIKVENVVRSVFTKLVVEDVAYLKVHNLFQKDFQI